MKKIFLIGDSILKGVIYSDEQHKYKLRAGHEFKSLEQAGFETVRNCSKMGATVTSCAKILERTLSEFDADTTVLFEIGGNDCDYNWDEISNDPSGTFRPNTAPREYMESYCACIRTVQKTGAKTCVSNLVPIDSDKYMAWISRGRNYESIAAWLGDISMLHRWQESYNRMAEEIAAKVGAKLLDIRSDFLSSHRFKTLLCSDGIHPTEAGHKMIEETLLRSLTA